MHSIAPYPIASQKLSLAEKAGQLFMPAAFINDSEEEIERLERLISEQHVGSICFFHSRASAATNFEGKRKVVKNEGSYDTLKSLIQRYQNAAKYPLLIAIDAEWGLAMRIENTPQYPYAITLGALRGNDDLIFRVGRQIAIDCLSAGIHWNLAPVVDINNNPNNPVIGYRSFGEVATSVVEKATAYIKGTQDAGVLTSIKHFPGHGDTATDSHLGLPVIAKTKTELLEKELYPFKKLIDQGVDSVMVGHLSVPALAYGKHTSSSISKDIIKGVLRQEMGFKGVVISDALNMHAVSKNYPKKGELEWLAFDAGNDILCFTEHTKEGLARITEKARKEQIEESFERVWKLKQKAFGNQVVVSPTDESAPLNLKIAEKSLTLYKGTAQGVRHFSEKDFVALYNSSHFENPFFQAIGREKKFNKVQVTPSLEIKDRSVLMALFPPQVKPNNNFGFSDEELKAINTLIAGNKVHLYLFGNPYVLNHINTEKAKTIVICYQHFPEFQQVAANHFLGNLEAQGRLPVTIREL
ncbi:glycoside hydrolase family 3 protein [Pseudozobellia thermophila]|uniref:beta-N-acetylhexosaminidase n=1 Tax=Pseudozobellia thermophila TaxID=192903 RepID=A0A1M6IZK0_9FLAO|nr:glycoside hydrolase family 3 N-terminal domain-containing protein [Pseudozobellia thermophila]SHJ39886.1 beta-glucosidase [Pseudozobellia thermophila]